MSWLKSKASPASAGSGSERDELDCDVVVRYNTVEMIGSDTTSSMRRVLLVEDDDILRRNYEALLGAHRLAVCACATKSEAMAAFKRDAFDVVILDVSLGGEYEAGFDLCQRFREQRKTTPIIFLTERDEDADRISGLRLGADDYLTKTISSAFLVARIHALIRRVETLLAGTDEPATNSAKESASRLRIDERLSRAHWLESPLDLSLTVLDTQGLVLSQRGGSLNHGFDACREHYSSAQHNCRAHKNHSRSDSRDHPEFLVHQIRAREGLSVGGRVLAAKRQPD